MTPTETRMRREVLEIPDAVERLLTQGTGTIEAAAKVVSDLNPRFLITVARGSSDHVATYLKYISELLLGVPVDSVGPSVASVYKAPLKLSDSESQSGQSPDIVEMTRAAEAGGALSLAITGNPDSPLARASAHCLNIRAGPELSVPATKTFVNSAVVGLLLLAHWRGDAALIAAIHDLPECLAKATRIDWPEVRAALDGHVSLYTLGRGPACAILNEAVLRFKETCQIDAESYSSAEVLHGPVSIVGHGFPLLGFVAGGPLVEVADQVAGKGATVFVTSSRATVATPIAHVRTAHPLTDPVTLIVSFYAMVEQVAVSRGIDPDAPQHLNKVTETV